MEQELLTILQNLSFFDEVSDSYLEPIASVARLKDYPTGTVIFHEGQKEARLSLIVKGTVSLEFCAPGVGCKCFQTVGAGDLLGWSPLLHLEGMMATARALEPTTAVLLDVKQLMALFEQNARFGYEFMSRVALVLAQRLGATRLQLLEVTEQLPAEVKHKGVG